MPYGVLRMMARKKIRALLPLAIAASVVAVLVYYFVDSLERKVVTGFLADAEPAFLAVNFLLIAMFFIASFGAIKKAFGKIKLSTWMVLIFIVLLGFSLRFLAAPQTHRVFFDEDIYLDIGKEILAHGKGALCNYGDSANCYEYDFMKWPNGYPFLLGASFLLFGSGESVAFNLVVILGSLSVFLVFLVSYLLLKNEKAALYSALLLALVPMHIVWSNTTASEPVFVFFALLSVLFFLVSFRTNSWKVSALAVFSLAYAAQIKTESVAVLPLILFAGMMLDKKVWKKLSDYRFYSLWIILLVLITPYLIHVYQASRYDPWGSSGEKFGVEYLEKNVPENAWFWAFGYPAIEHPALFTAFAVIGLVYLLRNERKSGLFLSVWFLAFFFLYASFYAGSVRYGTDVRYSLILYPPFVVMGGYGLYILARAGKKYERHVSAVLVSVILASFWLFYLPSVSTPAQSIEEARQARFYHESAVEFSGSVPEGCVILTHVPSIYLLQGKTSLQTWNAQTNYVLMKKIFNTTNCVIFDDGFWCGVEPYKNDVCEYVKNNYNLTLAAAYQSGETRYSFYYLQQI